MGGTGTLDTGPPLRAYWNGAHPGVEQPCVTLSVTVDTRYVNVQSVTGLQATPVGMLVGVGAMQFTTGVGEFDALRLSESTT
jgi:hypothetical protein